MAQHQHHDPIGSIPISQEKPQPDQGETPIPGAPKPRPTFSRKFLKTREKSSPWPIFFRLAVFGLLGTALCYLLGGYFLLPYLVQTLGAQALAKTTGRSVTFSRASFDPFTLRLEIATSIMGPRINDPEDTIDPIISFSKLTLRIDPRSLLHKGIICNELVLTGPFFHIKKYPDEAINLLTLWKQQTKQKPKTSPSLLESLFKYLIGHYSINNISIKNAEVIFDDATTNKIHHIENLELDLPTLATIDYRAPRIKPRFSAIVNGSPIVLSSNPSAPTDQSTPIAFALEMKAVDLLSYKKYLPPSLGQFLQGGTADFTMRLIYNPKESTPDKQLSFSGTLHANNVLFREPARTTTIESATLEGWVSPLSSRFFLDKVTINAPQLTINKTEANDLQFPSPFNLLMVSNLFSGQTQNHLGQLKISGASVTVNDSTGLAPPQNWTSVDLTAAAPSKENQTTRITISGKNGPTTHIRVEALLTQTSTSATTQGIFEAEELDLNLLASLSNHFVPSRLTQGTATRLKANFSSNKNDNTTGPVLTNVQIQARDLLFEEGGTAVASIQGWQSENGFSLASISKTNGITLNLGAVRVNNAKLLVSRASSNSSWRTIFTVPTSTANKTPVQTTLSSLEVVNGTINLVGTDRDGQPYSFKQLQLSAPQIRKEGANLFTASAQLNRQQIKTSGKFSIQPLTVRGQITADSLPVELLQMLMTPNDQFPIQGSAKLEGAFTMPNLSFDGAIATTDLALSDNSYTLTAPLASSPSLKIATAPLRLSLGKLSLERPTLKYTINNPNDSLLSPFASTTADSDQKKMPLRIESISVLDGSFLLTNPTGAPKYEFSTQQINGSLSSSTANNNAAFNFSGKMAGEAPLTVSGTVSLFSQPRSIQATYQLRNYPSQTQSDRISPYLGLKITDGQVDLIGQLKVEHGNLTHAVDLTSHNLKLGPPVESSRLHIKAELSKNTPLLQALLQNKQGELHLPLSISSPENTNSFSSSEAFAKELEKILLKTRVSPFSLLSGFSAPIPIESTIDFPVGSSHLSTTSQKHLHTFATLLKDRPLLTCVISGYADNEVDKKVLLDEINKEIELRQKRHEARLSQALSSAYGKEVIDQPFKSQAESLGTNSVAAKKEISLPSATLLKLAQERLKETHRFLLNEGVATDQLKSGCTAVIDSGHLGRSGNRVELGLEF